VKQVKFTICSSLASDTLLPFINDWTWEVKGKGIDFYILCTFSHCIG
jgi:hypothetical protein